MNSLMGDVLVKSLAKLKAFSYLDLSHSFTTTSVLASRMKPSPELSTEVKRKLKEAEKAILDEDRGKLRRPLLDWQLYMKERKGTPIPAGLKNGEIFRVRREEFEKLPQKDKNVYVKRAQLDHDRFLAEKNAQPEKFGRALSPYNFYVRERFPHRPADVKQTEYMQVLAKEYSALSDAEKAPYLKLHEKDKLRVGILRAEQPKQTEIPAGPRRPMSAYNLYMKERLLTRPDGQPMPATMKECGASWRAMTDAEKKPYLDRAPLKQSVERKRSLSAYNFFLKERASQGSGRETLSQAAVEWKLLDPAKKKRYEDLAAADALNFPRKGTVKSA